ncbi:MAG: 50S ribosomal protein L10 [Bacteroidales bacterium OttesenSCG-928-I14]|jgi:large subunit ribosomal protein L10|nr:50S ribosomal protein L10 [Bacteroidales bacterium OttesenSCG-928-I14]
MIKKNKIDTVKQIVPVIKKYTNFYLIDISSLNAPATNDLRMECYKQKIELVVIKNTLLKKALEQVDVDFSVLDTVLKGNTALMFSDSVTNPAILIKKFPNGDNVLKLKAAYIYESFYFGNENLDLLVSIKSKNELIFDIIFLLKYPFKKVVSSITFSKHIIHSILMVISQEK